jgi:hypothetical protein
MQRFAMEPPPQSGIQRMSPGGQIPASADPHPIDDPRLEQGTEVFRQLGFRVLMFAHKARLAALIVKVMGYDPIKAGDNLISLSHDASLAFRRKSIVDALRLQEDRPDNDHSRGGLGSVGGGEVGGPGSGGATTTVRSGSGG